MTLLTTENGIAVNMFIDGKTKTPICKELVIKTTTKYPVCWKTHIEIDIDGYIKINREWKAGDCIDIELDMRTKALRPIPYGSQILMNKAI